MSEFTVSIEPSASAESPQNWVYDFDVNFANIVAIYQDVLSRTMGLMEPGALAAEPRESYLLARMVDTNLEMLDKIVPQSNMALLLRLAADRPEVWEADGDDRFTLGVTLAHEVRGLIFNTLDFEALLALARPLVKDYVAPPVIEPALAQTLPVARPNFRYSDEQRLRWEELSRRPLDAPLDSPAKAARAARQHMKALWSLLSELDPATTFTVEGHYAKLCEQGRSSSFNLSSESGQLRAADRLCVWAEQVFRQTSRWRYETREGDDPRFAAVAGYNLGPYQNFHDAPSILVAVMRLIFAVTWSYTD